ncbi:MAG TPA: formyltransferase family protein, partial [Myxococcaceae bacterium]|nr:formyltransferase family protein [Myxococcaceae bacterium]
MTSDRGFSCFVIGEGSLLLQCGEQLLGNGNDLRGVISRDPTVRQWAKENGLPWADPQSDLRAFLGVAPFDYLFSITNPTVLSTEVLRLPRKLAVNYHDAPLPRYGGTYATSWALLGREKVHGITWHVMAERVDQGDILKQVQLEVEPGETALSLNFKCYEAALEAFTELLDELATGRLSRTPQDISRRSFFPRSRRPRAACTLSWQQSAEELDALFRALDFGNYLNPLGMPRILLGGRFYIAQECTVLPSRSTAPAGTLTGVEPDGLKVSTSSTELVIHRL